MNNDGLLGALAMWDHEGGQLIVFAGVALVTIGVTVVLTLMLAAIKFFLVDLAALDATYRVPSSIALGLFLLASSLSISGCAHNGGPMRRTE